MIRTQVQFDETTYRALKKRAADRGVSMSEVLRELVRSNLMATKRRPLDISDFAFVGSGRSSPSPHDPISENHDAALAEDFAK